MRQRRLFALAASLVVAGAAVACGGDDASAPSDAGAADGTSHDATMPGDGGGADGATTGCARFGFVVSGSSCAQTGCSAFTCSCTPFPKSVTSCTSDGCVVGADCSAICAASLGEAIACTSTHSIRDAGPSADAGDASEAGTCPALVGAFADASIVAAEYQQGTFAIAGSLALFDGYTADAGSGVYGVATSGGSPGLLANARAYLVAGDTLAAVFDDYPADAGPPSIEAVPLDGGPRSVIATTYGTVSPQVTVIAMDPTTTYVRGVLAPNQRALYGVPRSGGAPTLLAMDASDMISAYAGEAYYVSQSLSVIRAVGPSATPRTVYTPPLGTAVDAIAAADGFVFLAIPKNGTVEIDSVPSAGGSASVVGTIPQSTRAQSLAVDATSIYVGTPGTCGSIWRITRATGAATPIVAFPDPVYLALDSSFVYFASLQRRVIARVPK